jgi:transcriptional/translational regulatory protein YebC/TACO1
MEIVLDEGGEDIQEDQEDKQFEVYTAPDSLHAVKEALDAKGIPYQNAEITMIPKNTVRLEGKEAEQTLRLMDALEDNDDVQNVYSNFDISQEVMESLTGG